MEIKEMFNSHEITIIKPEKAAEGNPWVWRAEFLGAFDYADQALLRQGWHIAYYRICDMYGCPEAVELMKKFHDYVVEKYKLNKRAAIFGFSRGALYAVNYSVKYPKDISSLYLDAPVLDIRSWPAGKGNGKYSKKEWEECKALYGLDEEGAKNFAANPIDKAGELVDTKIPVILVAGDSDRVVPYEENGARLVAAYKKRVISLPHIVKQGCDHHPHSLNPPTEIVDFVTANFAAIE